jgi:hypothetical protein
MPPEIEDAGDALMSSLVWLAFHYTTIVSGHPSMMHVLQDDSREVRSESDVLSLQCHWD